MKTYCYTYKVDPSLIDGNNIDSLPILEGRRLWENHCTPKEESEKAKAHKITVFAQRADFEAMLLGLIEQKPRSLQELINAAVTYENQSLPKSIERMIYQRKIYCQRKGNKHVYYARA